MIVVIIILTILIIVGLIVLAAIVVGIRDSGVLCCFKPRAAWIQRNSCWSEACKQQTIHIQPGKVRVRGDGAPRGVFHP